VSDDVDGAVRAALEALLPRTWLVASATHGREGGWTIVLAQKRDDRELSVTVVASTVDDASLAARVVIGAAGIADAVPPRAAVAIRIAPNR
jgi:hypothetical protein